MRRRIDIRIPFTDFSFIMISVFMILISMGYFEGKIGEKFYSENEGIKQGEKDNKNRIKELYEIRNEEINSKEKILLNKMLNKTQLKQDKKDNEKLFSIQEKAIINYKKLREENQEEKKENIKETNAKIEEEKRYNSQVIEEELSKHDYIDLR